MFGKKEEPLKTEVLKQRFEEAPSSSIEQPKEAPTPVVGEDKAPHLYAKVPLLLIREPKEEDESAIYELGRSIPELECADGEEWLSKESVRHFVSYSTDKCLVAELESKIIAFVITEKSGWENGCITFLGVHPNYRKQGIGTYLLAQIESKLGVKDFYLFATSESAATYFEKMGYQKGKTMTFMSKTTKK